MDKSSTAEVIFLAIIIIIAVLVMALFAVGFIIHYHRRRREVIREQQSMKEAFQRELLQSQIETQNQTLQQIAHELHDNIGQLLTVIAMQLNSLEDEITHADTQHSLQQTGDLVRTVITDVRTLSKTLDYNTVQRFGFLPALTLELERIQHIGRVNLQLQTLGDACSLGQQTEIVLLRITQECLNNALKHAHAKHIIITADFTADDIFILTIADDGNGFNVHEINARTLNASGTGLHNLHRRTELLGGTCTIDSHPGQGTRIKIHLPHLQ